MQSVFFKIRRKNGKTQTKSKVLYDNGVFKYTLSKECDSFFPSTENTIHIFIKCFLEIWVRPN
jgi:hypothetical protein